MKFIHFTIITAILIILNSCGNSSPKIADDPKQNSDTIQFILTEYNNLKFKVLLNNEDSLDLKFDSGTTGLLLTHDAIKEKTNLLKNNKETSPTRNYVKLNSLSSMSLGDLNWDSLEVYPVAHSGHGTDGRFGWGLFKGKIVEINYDQNKMIIHENLPSVEGFMSTEINSRKTLFGINGEIKISGKIFEGPFLFDTGSQQALLLDSTIIAEQNFPKNLDILKEYKFTNGAGKIFTTNVVEIPQLSIAGQTAQNIPAQLLSSQNPAGFKTHILGNELLKRYNTFLDFKSMKIYLKENSLMNVPYKDGKK